MRFSSLLLLSLALSLALLAGCAEKSSDSGGLFEKLTVEEALKKAQEQNKLVFIDFYADWCGPCRQMDRETFSDPKIQEWLRQRFVCIKINHDHNKELVRKYGVRSLPTFVLLTADGNQLPSVTGGSSPERFKARIESVLP